MAALEIFTSLMARLCSCVKGSNAEKDDECYDREDGRREVIVTTNNVSNVTCCGAKAANKNEDDVYVKAAGDEAKTIDKADTQEDHGHRSLRSNTLSQSNFRLDGDRFFEVDISYSASREENLDCTGTAGAE